MLKFTANVNTAQYNRFVRISKLPYFKYAGSNMIITPKCVSILFENSTHIPYIDNNYYGMWFQVRRNPSDFIEFHIVEITDFGTVLYGRSIGAC